MKCCISSAFAISCCVFVASPLVSEVPGGHLVKVSPDQTIAIRNRIDRNSLPRAESISILSCQAFIVRAVGKPDLTLIPIAISSALKGNAEQCGVYFLPSEGKGTYVSTEAQKYPPACEGITAVGAVPDESYRPRLILMMTVRTGPGQHDPAPFLLSWDESTSVYKIDTTETNLFANTGAPTKTVAQVRRLLLQHFPEAKRNQ